MKTRLLVIFCLTTSAITTRAESLTEGQKRLLEPAYPDAPKEAVLPAVERLFKHFKRFHDGNMKRCIERPYQVVKAFTTGKLLDLDPNRNQILNQERIQNQVAGQYVYIPARMLDEPDRNDACHVAESNEQLWTRGLAVNLDAHYVCGDSTVAGTRESAEYEEINCRPSDDGKTQVCDGFAATTKRDADVVYRVESHIHNLRALGPAPHRGLAGFVVRVEVGQGVDKSGKSITFPVFQVIVQADADGIHMTPEAERLLGALGSVGQWYLPGDKH